MSVTEHLKALREIEKQIPLYVTSGSAVMRKTIDVVRFDLDRDGCG